MNGYGDLARPIEIQGVLGMFGDENWMTLKDGGAQGSTNNANLQNTCHRNEKTMGGNFEFILFTSFHPPSLQIHSLSINVSMRQHLSVFSFAEILCCVELNKT